MHFLELFYGTISLSELFNEAVLRTKKKGDKTYRPFKYPEKFIQYIIIQIPASREGTGTNTWKTYIARV